MIEREIKMQSITKNPQGLPTQMNKHDSLRVSSEPPSKKQTSKAVHQIMSSTFYNNTPHQATQLRQSTQTVHKKLSGMNVSSIMDSTERKRRDISYFRQSQA